MKLESVLGIAVTIACFVSEPAFGANSTFATYSLFTAVVDSTLPNPLPTGISESDIDFGEGTFSLNRDLELGLGGASSAVAASYKVGKGVISLYAGASGTAHNDGVHCCQFTAGGGTVTVEGGLFDRWTLTTPSPVASALLKGSFKISASVAADSTGVSGTDPGLRDRVESTAEASLRIRGTGILASPYAFQGIPDLWAYSEHREGTNASVTDVQLPLPMKEIPVTVIVTGGSAAVEWYMTVSAKADVGNKDNTNFSEGVALATADASHTLRWGGITSVIDLSTGEPITDWTLTSDSGFDWTHAAVIPEPTASAMALMALGGLMVYRRRINSEKSSRSA